MKANPPQINSEELSTFCHRHHIKKLSLFGSVLRSDFNETSDLDVLVEFEPADIPGLIRLSAIERELTVLFGRKVDLRTPQDLSRYFRDQVLTTARVQYAK
jgi:predicted nucleotidyltransferase